MQIVFCPTQAQSFSINCWREICFPATQSFIDLQHRSTNQENKVDLGWFVLDIHIKTPPTTLVGTCVWDEAFSDNQIKVLKLEPAVITQKVTKQLWAFGQTLPKFSELSPQRLAGPLTFHVKCICSWVLQWNVQLIPILSPAVLQVSSRKQWVKVKALRTWSHSCWKM